MKYIICKRLAACVRLKRAMQFASSEPELSNANTGQVAVGDRRRSSSNGPGHRNSVTAATGQTAGSANNESVEKLLRDIRDLLESRIRGEDRRRRENAEMDQRKSEWLLAAAVVDRFCAVAFAVMFIGGNLLFFILFFTHT